MALAPTKAPSSDPKRTDAPAKAVQAKGGCGLPLYVQASAMATRRDAPTTADKGAGADVGGKRLLEVASGGVANAATPLPHADRIQGAFGAHDISHVRTDVGGQGGAAAQQLGARAYTVGDRIGFKDHPDLHLAAHEAAHVVQQQAGVQLEDGVGAQGDRYEQQADAVADAVVAGKSAEGLLGSPREPGEGAGVQMACSCGGTCASCSGTAPPQQVQFALAPIAVHVAEPHVFVPPVVVPHVLPAKHTAPAAPATAAPASGGAAPAVGPDGEPVKSAEDQAFDAEVEKKGLEQCHDIPDKKLAEAGDEPEEKEPCSEVLKDPEDPSVDEDEPANKAPPEPDAPETKVHGKQETPAMPSSDDACAKAKQKAEPEKPACGEEKKDAKPTPPPEPAAPEVEPDPPVHAADLDGPILGATLQRDEAIAAYDREQQGSEAPMLALEDLAANSVRFRNHAGDPEAGRDEDTSASIASTTLGKLADDVREAVGSSTVATIEQLQAGLAETKDSIAQTAQVDKIGISMAFANARAEARRAANKARGTVELEYVSAMLRAVASTATTIGDVETGRAGASALVDLMGFGEQLLIGQKISQGETTLDAAGATAGRRAINIGNEMWAKYHRGRINRKDSFMKGHLTDRRAEARKKAAMDTSKAYRDQFLSAAADQAWQFHRAGPQYCRQVVATVMGAHRGVDQQAQAFTKALGEMLPGVLGDAADARGQLISAIDDKLARQLRTLSRNEAAQHKTVDDTAYLQQLVAEQTAHAAGAQLIGGTTKAGQGMHDGLVEVRDKIEAGEAPPPEVMRAAMAHVETVIGGGLAMLREQHALGLDAALVELRDQRGQSRDQLDQIQQRGEELAGNLSKDFDGAMEAAATGAKTAFDALADGYAKQMAKVLATAHTGYGCALIAVYTAFVQLNQAITKGAEAQAKSLTESFNEQLDGTAPPAAFDACGKLKPHDAAKTNLRKDIAQNACEAAEAEKPAWETVLEFILIIIVSLVLMVVLGPLVAAVLGEGLLFLAAMGAIIAVASNGISNLFAGRPFFKGALKAAVIGALTNMLTGGLGGGMGISGAIEGPIVNYLARQFVVDIVTEYANQVLSNLWEGKGWSSFYKLDWHGFALAAAMSGPMALFGRALHLRTKFRNANPEHLTRPSGEPPHVEPGAPHVEGEPGGGPRATGEPGAPNKPRSVGERALDALIDLQKRSKAAGEALAKRFGGGTAKGPLGARPPAEPPKSEPTAPKVEPAAPKVESTKAAAVEPTAKVEPATTTAAPHPDPTVHVAEPGIHDPPTAADHAILDQTRAKQGSELTPGEIAAERRVAEAGERHASTKPPFTEAGELPNGHDWEETPDGTFCRFSNGGCVDAQNRPTKEPKAAEPKVDPGGRGNYTLDDGLVNTLGKRDQARLRALEDRMPANAKELAELVRLRRKANGGTRMPADAGTPEHMLDRWNEYDGDWNFKRWAAGHPSRMQNSFEGVRIEKDYARELAKEGIDAASGYANVGEQRRQVDLKIAGGAPNGDHLIQIKSGSESLTTKAREGGGASAGSSSHSNKKALAIDGKLVDRGDRVTWVFEEPPSGPLVKEALAKGVEVVQRVNGKGDIAKARALLERAGMTEKQIDAAIAAGKLTYVRGGRKAIVKQLMKPPGGT